MKTPERQARAYLERSAGNCNVLSDHVMVKFACFVIRGDLTLEDFRRIGGESGDVLAAKVGWMVRRMERGE